MIPSVCTTCDHEVWNGYPAPWLQENHFPGQNVASNTSMFSSMIRLGMLTCPGATHCHAHCLTATLRAVQQQAPAKPQTRERVSEIRPTY